MFIVTAKEMYDIDHCTMEKIGFGKLLMENAGRAVAEKVRQKVNAADKILIVVGPGNNGGDGYVIARTLQNEQYRVSVLQVVPDQKLSEQVQFFKQLYLACNGTCLLLDDSAEWKQVISEADVVIDSLLGIGVDGLVREPLASVIAFINEKGGKIVSVDIPSGLPADEGAEAFTSIQADETIVIAAPKTSVFLPHTANYYGNWEVVSIGHPQTLISENAACFVADDVFFRTTMPKRDVNSHKGDHGKGLVIGGCDNMPGSFAMTVRAALRTGAGLMTAVSTEKVIDRIACLSPEAMYQIGASEKGHLIADDLPLDDKDGVAFGIGVGRETKTAALLESVLQETTCPLIIDGDGLYLLQNQLARLKQRNEPTILTPHMGEMARLLEMDISDLTRSPFRYAREFAEEHHVYVVLKGKYTIITSPDGNQAVSTTGNPGLAKGGSGDVLTGIILAMMMQSQSIFQSLCNACFVHGMSADLQVQSGHSYHDLLATDVIEGIASVYRTFS
ncbi:NAD(P)H-hydrate dehydratase [Virgibacillus halophilus]|uniref:Bifunctional NAD(P)H-hydrate repair enzyme n=1 Tax=Tigheibacillus halophilus TaxID=361280 RepID=A0ABU5C8B7_9BACI|nr:NAD(P)H-hydrate dehydratase [Virgibacillus halophilus]